MQTRPREDSRTAFDAVGNQEFTTMLSLGRSLLEASVDCITLLDLTGNIVFINDAGLALLEATNSSSLCGKPWIELWPKKSRTVVGAALQDATSGSTTRFVASCPTLKGAAKWWDVVVASVRGLDVRPNQIMAVCRDISKQKANAELMAASTVRFRALANSIPQLAWMADASGHIYWYNDRWFDYTGTTLEEMKGWGWLSVHHPDHAVRVKEKLAESFRTGEAWEDTFPLRGKEGAYRWFLSRANPVRDTDGQVSLWCGTNTDITNELTYRQRLERKVRLIELSHEAFLVRDQDDKIELWNSGCIDLFGYSREEAIGAQCDDLLKTEFPGGKLEIERALKENCAWSGELLHHAKDGSRVWVESRQQLLNSGGKCVVIECDRDTTERRTADEIRRLLIGELSHRVNNSLAVVQAIATQTGRRATNVSQFLQDFGGRIEAMSAAHNLLNDANWSGVELQTIIESQPLLRFGSDRSVCIHGEAAPLSAKTAMHLVLVLHELATNAQKYGSLSAPGGRLEISWRNLPGEVGKIEMVWRELGGPIVQAPQSKGFGLSLIERSKSLPFLAVTIAFETMGVVCKMRMDSIRADTQDPPYFRPGQSSRGS